MCWDWLLCWVVLLVWVESEYCAIFEDDNLGMNHILERIGLEHRPSRHGYSYGQKGLEDIDAQRSASHA